MRGDPGWVPGGLAVPQIRVAARWVARHCTDSIEITKPATGGVAVIEASHLSKRYGTTMAVDDLSFRVPPGRVTGFLGPNGAGKTTTMRLLLGLARPERRRTPALARSDTGSATSAGRRGHRLGRSERGSWQASRRVFARHEPAPRLSVRAAWRPE